MFALEVVTRSIKLVILLSSQTSANWTFWRHPYNWQELADLPNCDNTPLGATPRIGYMTLDVDLLTTLVKLCVEPTLDNVGKAQPGPAWVG